MEDKLNYLDLINKYGSGLRCYQKPVARKLFSNLLNKGWTYEQIFWGIKLLKGRPIEKYIGLFYYDEYIQEIEQKVIEAHELINLPHEEKLKQLDMLVGFGTDSIPEEYKNELFILHDKIFNSDKSDKQYSKAEIEDKINYLYEKCYLIPSFEFPLDEIDKDDFLHRKYFYSRTSNYNYGFS